MTVYKQRREFFQRNPGEELATVDVMAKCDCGKRSAQVALARLYEERVLDRRKEGQTVIYFPRYA